MLDKIKALQEEIEKLVAASKEEVDDLRIKYISKKGSINQLFADFKNVSVEEKKEVGQAINTLKNFALDKINALKEGFENDNKGDSNIDLTMPGEPFQLGTRHPLALVKNEIIAIFSVDSVVR